MANWIVDFKSIAGNLYRILIDGAPGQSDISLTPSDHPFYIEEEGKEDLFVPVKTQSGYVEVITDDFSLLKQILPSKGGTRSIWFGIYSEYTEEYTILFKGWIQPKILSFKIWSDKQKLRIPIECELSALKYRRDNISSRNIIEIYKLIGGILTTGHPVPFEQIGIGGDYILFDNSDHQAWLNKKVYTSVFFDGNQNYLEMLEKICTFFGWTARTAGNSVSLIPNRNWDSEYRGCFWFYFDDFKEGNIADTHSTRWNSERVEDDAICNNNLLARYAEGVGKATVTCPLQSFDSSMSFPDDAIKQAINNGQIASTKEYSSQYHPEVHPEWTEATLRYNITAPTSFPFALGNDWNLLEIANTEVLLDKGEEQSPDVADWSYKLKIWDSGEMYQSYGYNKYGRHEIIRRTERSAGVFGIQSNSSMNFSTKGVLSFTLIGKTYEWRNLNENPDNLNELGTKNFDIKVQIGNLWYNKSTNAWEANVSEDDKWKQSDTEGKADFQIPSIGISGNVTIYIRPVPKVGYVFFNPPTCVELSGLRIEYAATEDSDINSNISEVTFKASNDAFAKEKSYSTVLCVKEEYMRQSQNILLNDDESQCVGLAPSFSSDERFNPLLRLVEEVITETSLQNIFVEIPVRMDRLSDIYELGFSFSLFRVSGLDGIFYPVAYSYDARTEEMKLKLIKRQQ